MTYAEILTIGDEILYGQITNTNAKFISAELDKIGIKVIRHSSVGDKESEILAGLRDAQERADIIIMTGGLGPTKDDITKKTIAKFFGVELIFDQKVMDMIVGMFQRFGREMTENNKVQAYIPANCEVLYNLWGTAPATWIAENGKVFVSMPGVPVEMEKITTELVIPKLQSFFKTPNITHKIIHTIGIGESSLAEKIEQWEDNLPPHIGLAYLPHFMQVRLRLTGVGEDKEKLQQEIDEQAQKVLPLIEKYVFGYNTDTIESVIASLLKENNKTISTAESCTGGFLAHNFTKIAGSSAYYMGGVISYSNESKTNLLGVNPDTIEKFGAVSEETVKEMAEGVRKRLGTDIGVATSGIAGPDGGTPDKPVGTIWIAYSDEKGTTAKKLQLIKDRMLNIQFTAILVLDLIRKNL
jgi:nicotinamide-nucleotide amidase